MSERSVGTFYRRVLIDPGLQTWVNVILLASAPDEPAVLVAKKRIQALATPENSYLLASEIRGYLEEKTRIGTEPWVFPVAGDLFLDALEAGIAVMGPNLFLDHYSGASGCYRAGDDPARFVQGELYCADLALEKTMGLFLAKDSEDAAQDAVTLSFLSREDVDYRRNITVLLEFGRQCLQKAVDATLRASRTQLQRAFLDFVGDRRERLQKVLGSWSLYHKDACLADKTNEQYLEGAASVAAETGYAPLDAMVKERQVLLREQLGLRTEGKTELEEEVHPLYNAAALYVAQGNHERAAGAYAMAVRRYNRAARLFTKIDDRTSTAKALVERARAYMQSGHDPEAVQEGLHSAVRLVVAHIKNLPHGVLPTITDESVMQFLKSKGYELEAVAYAEALERVAAMKAATTGYPFSGKPY